MNILSNLHDKELSDFLDKTLNNYYDKVMEYCIYYSWQ